MGERPESFRIGLELGYLHQALGDFAAARSEYKSIIRESPKSDYTRAARLNLANIDAESGYVDRARAEYESLLAEDPQDQTTRFSSALLHLRRGEIKQAEADLDVILRPGSVVDKRHEIVATRAVARLLLRRTTEAAADAAEAQRLKPCPPYERLWQRTLLAAGRYDELQLDRPEEIRLLPVGGASLAADLRAAVGGLSRLTKGKPSSTCRASLNQAVIQAALGDYPASFKASDQALAISSASPQVHLIRARIHHHAGQRQRTLEEIKQGQECLPDEPGLGSPALLMIQGCKPAQHTLFSLGFSVVVNWRGTVIIKSAGEPRLDRASGRPPDRSGSGRRSDSPSESVAYPLAPRLHPHAQGGGPGHPQKG
jgi:tetratricopeptide (TPR) repeat protein